MDHAPPAVVDPDEGKNLTVPLGLILFRQAGRAQSEKMLWSRDASTSSPPPVGSERTKCSPLIMANKRDDHYTAKPILLRHRAVLDPVVHAAPTLHYTL